MDKKEKVQAGKFLENQLKISKQWFIDSHIGNIKEVYHFQERLGAGGFGVVYLAKHRKNEGMYAVKAIQKSRIRDYETFQNEIKILKTLDHPNIIKLHEIWEWQQICFLVTEYCEGGELFHYILKNKHLKEKEAAMIMKQAFSALKYLHFNKISHRDIKPENFLLKHKDDITNIKLIDFGLSKDFSESNVMQTPSGSPYYIAPEVFNSEYDQKCDLWSIGVVLYILLSGKVPFPGESNKEIIENVLRADYHFDHEAFERVSDTAKDLISKLLVKDVNKRFSAEESYDHPWIQELNDQKFDRELAADAYINMKRFLDAVNLKKTTLTLLASKLPENHLEDLRKTFIAIDKNGDGKIEEKEFLESLEMVGATFLREEVKQMMDTLDTNKNGYIDYTEFLAGCMRSKIYLKEDHLRAAFEFFDIDNSGSITKDELKAVLCSDDMRLPEEEINKLLEEVDINKDNQIDYNEFIEMMKKDLQV